MRDMGSRPVLYISGPFDGPDPIHDIGDNIKHASRAALEGWRKGWAVICPHKNTAGFQHVNEPWETWMEGDLAFIERMDPARGDAMYMIGGWLESKGAKMEHMNALAKGLQVYYWPKPLPVAYNIAAEPKPLNIKSDLADDNAVVPESVLLLIAILGAGVLYLLWRIGEVLG